MHPHQPAPGEGGPPSGASDGPGGDAVAGAPARTATVRPGGPADAGPAARLHSTQIPSGFLSVLGPGFLRLLYRRVGVSETSFLLVAESEGHPVGFLAGSTDLAALYRAFVRRDGPRALAVVGTRLLSAPRRAIETLRYRRHDAGGGDPEPELLAMAVDPAWRGRGVGRLLVTRFQEEMRRRGASRARVVVGADNTAARGLYERCGFVGVSSFELHAGTTSLVLRWEADRASAAPAARP